MEEMDKLITTTTELGIEWAPRLATALIVLLVGLWLVRLIDKGVHRFFTRKAYDPALESFLASLISIALKIMLVITVVSMLGVQMTSFIALLGAAGLAIGMALSGTLQNFAGSIMLMIFKPYKLGDMIETQGHTGRVDQINIFNTILKTADKRTIIIPNGPVSSDSIVNYTDQGSRRAEIVVGIGYDDDIDKAKQVIRDVLARDERIFKDPEPFIGISDLGDNSVNFVIRAHGTVDDYWGIYHDNIEAIKKAFDAAGISIPYPQRDVHLYRHTD